MTAPEATISRISPQFIVNRQGKDHVLFAGLLDLAHREGNLKAIRTQLLQAPMKDNAQTAIVHATVEGLDGRIFDGIGDANAENVGRMIAAHIIRMAETRAKARALRDFLNIGGAALEELGRNGESEDDEDLAPAQEPARQAAPRQQQPPRQEQPSPAPATEAQYAQLNAMGAKLLNEFGKDVSAHITDDLTMARADIVLAKLGVTYRQLAAQAALPPVATATPATPTAGGATQMQIDKIHKLQAALGRPAMVANNITAEEAVSQIAELVRIFNTQAKQPQKAGTR